MADFNGFAKEIRLLGATIEKNADQFVRKAALQIDRGVVMATPVDTGRARANWRVQAGEANPEVLFPAPAAPPSPGEAASQALAEGETNVARYHGDHGEGEIHISNNLPYIGPLNRGHSQQAPRYFVQAEVMRVAEELKGANVITGVSMEEE